MVDLLDVSLGEAAPVDPWGMPQPPRPQVPRFFSFFSLITCFFLVSVFGFESVSFPSGGMYFFDAYFELFLRFLSKKLRVIINLTDHLFVC